MELFNSVQQESKRRGETNDCTVKAIAIASGLPYDKVHAALAKHGRKNGRGCNILVQVAAMQDLGIKYDMVPLSPQGLQRRTMKTIGKALSKGRYLVYVRGHVAAVINGNVEDWTNNRRHKVKEVIRVEAHQDSGLIDKGKTDDFPYVDQWDVVEPKPAPRPRKRGAGDEVSQILADYLDGVSTERKGEKLSDLAATFGFPHYLNLNTGQRRMNMGNRLRSMVKRGQITPDGIRSLIRTI